MADFDDILTYWFGTERDPVRISAEKSSLWWQGGQQTDAAIRARFGEDLRRARGGEYDHWTETPRGRLGLIILLDQFSRNVHRGTPEAFAADPKAQKLTLEGLERGDDRRVAPIERVFFYMPLEHAEQRALQDRSMVLFQDLLNESPPEHRSLFESFLDFAARHRDIVARFGRFPHRNKVLGRTSTGDEMEFLTQPGSSF